MGRWRPPVRQPSRYITPDGYRRLNDELQHLWKVQRPIVTESVREAAAQGDRSENAEYIYGKKMLREIDARIRHLSRRLDGMVVVDRAPDDQQRIYFGAWVTLEDQDLGATVQYRIVGPDETDGERGWISMDSPLARAMLKRQAGDQVDLDAPSGKRSFIVLTIAYNAPPIAP